MFKTTIALVFLLSTPCLAQTVSPTPPTAPFARDINKYPGLLPEFARFIDRVQHNVQFPPERFQSRLLPLLPESTLVYAAIPNYGDSARQLLDVLRWELEHGRVVADWWQHGELAAAGPKLEDYLERFYELSQYLGDEIVVSGGTNGREPNLLMIAEVHKPGLKKFLQKMVKDLGREQKSPVRILDAQELAAAESGRLPDEPVVLVRSDYVVVAPSLAAAHDFNARLDRSAGGFVSTSFGRRVAQAYEGGTTILAAADLHRIMSQLPSQLSAASNPNAFAGLTRMEHALNFSLKDDLLNYLGGVFLSAFQNQVVLEVQDAGNCSP
jgi:hypothetical protein